MPVSLRSTRPSRIELDCLEGGSSDNLARSSLEWHGGGLTYLDVGASLFVNPARANLPRSLGLSR